MPFRPIRFNRCCRDLPKNLCNMFCRCIPITQQVQIPSDPMRFTCKGNEKHCAFEHKPICIFRLRKPVEQPLHGIGGEQELVVLPVLSLRFLKHWRTETGRCFLCPVLILLPPYRAASRWSSDRLVRNARGHPLWLFVLGCNLAGSQ